ncbi:MAG: DUF1036 domain-containing protein [Alphaproteobacteria bacterium]
MIADTRFARRNTLAGALVTASLVLGGAAHAEAPLEICNRTELPTDCMVGLEAGGVVKVSGSYRIDAGQCKEFADIEGSMYYHCVQKQFNPEANRWLETGRWEGEQTFCVPQYQKSFSLAQVERITKDCEAHGYTSLGFEKEDMSGNDIIEIDLEG